MWRLRLLLLPFGVVVELVILGVCWLLATVSPDRSRRLMQWATQTLPDLGWYTGEDHD